MTIRAIAIQRTFLPLFCVIGCTFAIVSCRQSPQAYLAKGNQLYDAGKYDEAVLNYKKALQKDPRFGEASYRLGLAEIKKGDAPEAYRALTSAYSLLPDRMDVKLKLADFLLLSYFSTKSRPAAFYTQLNKISDEFLSRDHNSYDGLRIKGNLAWTDGRLKEAEDLFSRANAAKPMEPDVVVSWIQVLFQDGQSPLAERLASDTIQAHKEVGQLYDLLYIHYRSQNRLVDAENILRSKVNNNPHDIRYPIELAMFYAGTGKRDQMTATLQRVLDDTKTFPKGRLMIGDLYADLQEWPEAVRQYEAGAQLDTKEKAVYLKRIADAWLAQGKGDQAAGVLSEILKQNSSDEAAKAVNASLLLKSGRPENIRAAIRDLRELVNKQPENLLFHFLLGRALLATGDEAGAREQFQESLKKNPQYLPSAMVLAEMSLSKQDYTQALEFANRVSAVNPRLGAAALVRTAALIGTQKYTEAREELTRLAQDAPQNPEVQFRLASLDLAEKRFPDAEARLKRLREADPLRAVSGLAAVYSSEGEFDKAVSLLNLELGKSANPAAIHTLLADTFLRAKKYDSALEQYSQIYKLGIRTPELNLRIGQIYQQKGNFDEAVKSFLAAEKLAPHDTVVTSALADALRLAGHPADAIVAYRRLLVIDPDNANAMNNLAYTLMETGDSADEAESLIQRALQKSPHSPNFADTLGMIYLKKNLQDSAVQIFSGLAKRSPDNPVFLYHYALSLSQKGERSKARAELEVALQKKPPEDLRRSIQMTLAKVQ